tara:strand:+ start:96191 stop:96622 length:432 start_codon:yes stop_codon:yes gene_type:complete
METLTIKELAPYLPYGLKIDSGGFEDTRIMDADIESNCKIINIGACIRMQYKPLLRPLSDLTKEEYWKLSGKDSKDSFGFWYGKDKRYGFLHFEGYTSRQYSLDIINKIPYYAFEFLVKNHFDVFGLIEKGLAIDLNTIKETE